MDLSPAEFIQWAAIIREETRPDDAGHDARRLLEGMMIEPYHLSTWDLDTALRRLWK